MTSSSSEEASRYPTTGKHLPKDDKDYAAMPFDGVLRTTQQALHRLIILLMNRIFDMAFTGDEKIEPGPTEMMLLKPDASRVRRGVDAHFTIVDSSGARHIFHIECQTNPDGSIILRFAEYDLQLAVESRAADTDGMLDLYLPNSVLLNLRGSSAPKQIRIHKDDQTLIQEIRVQNMTDLSVGELFAKDALALLPFWIFTHGDRLPELVNDPAEEKRLIEEFRFICRQLNIMAEGNEINSYEHGTLLELIRKATRNAVPGTQLEKEVKEMADANIFELETVRFYNDAREAGYREAETDHIRQLLAYGMTPEAVSAALEIPLERIEKEQSEARMVTGGSEI